MEADFEKRVEKMDPRFEGNEWTLESKRAGIDDAVNEIIRRMKESGWNEDEIGLFQVAITEALANAIIHGNLGLKKDQNEDKGVYDDRVSAAENDPKLVGKKVLVGINIAPDEAIISVTDEGDFVAKEKSAEVEDANIYTYSGLGGGLIYLICDRVETSPGKVTLYKKRNAEAKK
ncbi:MAG: ATP-binding protein [Patescibacteria group bacterium]